VRKQQNKAMKIETRLLGSRKVKEKELGAENKRKK
jgi:hypothetical protein